ncbi:hypothetical protein DL766_006540 [Monosporascus sp. MC13-8B]|uniref:Uncharacterized protein n=1 Tax=Monosporascus cannonballus TaxID=155416 RepID=A0ABY0GUZ1_9PEZI|nr:hypothetical protein DL763_011015 [Monosporascus cannonballus]RYO77634.1 hypothetical protein DL762_009137 [Monosporascus cannonballus]RYP27002.1 hypothetical protein DL766_006540 [Monosporascus sp. MC13-8B]
MCGLITSDVLLTLYDIVLNLHRIVLTTLRGRGGGGDRSGGMMKGNSAFSFLVVAGSGGADPPANHALPEQDVAFGDNACPVQDEESLSELLVGSGDRETILVIGKVIGDRRNVVHRKQFDDESRASPFSDACLVQGKGGIQARLVVVPECVVIYVRVRAEPLFELETPSCDWCLVQLLRGTGIQ